jgi:hypothetical protein
MKARLVPAAVGVSVLVAGAAASAEPMDPALERLVVNPRCNGTASAANEPGVFAGGDPCVEDNAAFKKLINQWGFAVAPNATHSARTTGYGGFHVSIEAAYTSIDADADYWKRGTRGPVDPTSNQASYRNSSPASVLQLYSVKLRKSFGFGLELAGAFSLIPDTSLLTGGADVRLSLLEGFRTGVPGALPDLAVGSGVRTVSGTPQFYLTVASLDIQISKPLPIADSSIITPYLGYQYLWIFGDSGLVDLTPATDPLGYCQFTGPNLPGNQDPDPERSALSGQPVCNGGSAADFNNNSVFDNTRLERQRLLFGLNYRYEMVVLGAQFITDLLSPANAQAGRSSTIIYRDGDLDSPVRVDDEQLLADEPRQWTLVLQLGTMF